MKKIILNIAILLALSGGIEAQTIGQFTMWNQNHYIVNPAAAGNLDYFDVAVGYRRQWAGIKEAPKTIYATGHTVLNRPKTFERSALRGSETENLSTYKKGKNLSKPMVKHALGGKISSNEFGAFKKTEATLTYALHLPLFKDVSLSFGLSGGLNNYGLNESRINAIQENDPIVNAYLSGENSNKLNIDAGTYIYSDKFFLGYSANQILQNDLDIADVNITSGLSSVEIHHFLIGGYNFDLSNNLRLTPNVIAKSIKNNPESLDFNATLTYKESIYGGLTFRTTDAISLMGGVQLSNLFRMGYAYDYTMSELKAQSNGSHEIFIGLTLF